MSDQPPPHPLTEAELSARPRGLAALGKASTPGKGAQIRSRAARRRGRRAVLSTTALAAAALTCGALGSLAEQPSSPAMSAAQPSPVRTQRVTVGLDAHTLTIEGKRFTIGAPHELLPDRRDHRHSGRQVPFRPTPPQQTPHRPCGRPELGRPLHRPQPPTAAAAVRDGTLRLPTLGKDGILGAVALAPEDGKQVYVAIKPGARVEIKGRQAASTASNPACIDRQPITGTH